MQLEDFFTEFERALLESDHSQRTVQGYIRDLRAFEQWFIDTRGVPPALPDLTPLDVRDYRDHLLHTRKLKPASINRRLSGLRAYLEFAVDRKLLPRNPAAKIRGIKQTPHAPRWLTPAEQRRLRRAFDREVQIALADNAGDASLRLLLATRDRAIFLLLLNTGLRSMELTQLTLDDIDLSERHRVRALSDRSGTGTSLFRRTGTPRRQSHAPAAVVASPRTAPSPPGSAAAERCVSP